MKQFFKLIPVLHWAGLKSASVKVAVPSKVQQQLHLEKMFALLYPGKEIRHIYYDQKAIRRQQSNGRALRALQLSKPTKPAPTTSSRQLQTSPDVT